ncbi:hypothetical protein ICW40_15080 [Actinotalea ferrariae]|uniref:keratin n=1 Tax=Actinotalea ferrariae TaxID=1386098 RepID=UPI001EB1B857|nr:keratin [Actinotalea ferrariae]MBX9246123.1 hypothetical protein [Actinotalea ferrariae]
MTDPSTADRSATAPPVVPAPRPGGTGGTPSSDGAPRPTAGDAPDDAASGTAAGGTASGTAENGRAPQDAAAASPATGTAGGTADGRRTRRAPTRRVVLLGVLVLLLLLTAAAAVHLYRTSTAWEDRAEEYRRAAEGLGTELATTRASLEGARAELEGVRTQLATANERIVELADEKAQLGDDREVQRQLVDYQERVSEAAGTVALALDQCVQGQNQLIGYMENAAQYDPVELERFGDEVQTLCQQATDANAALQRELSQ